MIKKYKDIIAKRISTHPEYDFGIKECWNEALLLVKDDPESVISFICDDATDEEVYWFSEILCDIYDLIQDERIIDAFRKRADKMSDEEMQRSVLQEIKHI